MTKTFEKAIKELVEGTVLNDGEVRVGEFLNWSCWGSSVESCDECWCLLHIFSLFLLILEVRLGGHTSFP